MADLFCLDLKTDDNEGGSLSTADLYKHLIDVRIFGFNNNDTALALQRRKDAREGAEILTETTRKVVAGNSNPISADHGILSKATGAVTGVVTGITSKIPVVGGLVNKVSHKVHANTGSLRWYGQNAVKELIAAGTSPDEAADICWLTAVGGVGAPIGVVRIPPSRLCSKKCIE